MIKLYSPLISLLLFITTAYGQPGGSACDSATLLPLPNTVLPYYNDTAAWSSTGFQTQASPAWFRFIVPAGKPITDFMIAGGAHGYCSTTNKRLTAEIYKGSCAAAPSYPFSLNYCTNTGGPFQSNWNEQTGRAWIKDVSAGDTFYIKVSGATSLGYSIGLRWYNDIPRHDSCAQTDTIQGPVTYGSSYYADTSSWEPGMVDSTGMSICQWWYPYHMGHTNVIAPVYYTLVPILDSFRLQVQPISCFDRGGHFRLWAFKDCAHIGDYSKDSVGRYKYFYGCSDTSGITVTNVQSGVPLVIRVEAFTWLTGDFEIWTSDACTFKIIGEGFLMPMKLVKFDATYRKAVGTTILSWTTHSETRNSRFIIERSEDGSRFFVIGEVWGDERRNEYSFTDTKNIAGKTYYRLKVLNADGRYSYSRMAIVNAERKVSAFVYPNPAHDVVTVIWNAKTRSIANVTLMNSVGIISLSRKWSIVPGRNSLSLNIASLPKGIYYLKIKSSDDEVFTEQVLIQ